MNSWVVIALLVYIFIREWFFIRSTHLLLEKLMSRNYYDYQVSKDVGRIKESVQPIRIEDDDPEDLGILSQTF